MHGDPCTHSQKGFHPIVSDPASGYTWECDMVARRKPVVSTDFVGWMAIVVTSRKVSVHSFLGLATFNLSSMHYSPKSQESI